MLKRQLIVMLGGLALFIGGSVSLSRAAPTTDAVVGPPCGEAEFDTALMMVQASPSGGTLMFTARCGGMANAGCNCAAPVFTYTQEISAAS